MGIDEGEGVVFGSAAMRKVSKLQPLQVIDPTHVAMGRKSGVALAGGT